jgi:endonuclease YncB( thermonuclease family)
MSNQLQSVTISALALAAVVTLAAASAAPCAFELQGEGRVTEVTDARSFRLADGRDVRLGGIEPAFPAEAKATAERQRALTAILAGRDLRLRGEDDTPDRYGRQTAFVLRLPEETLVQQELLTEGAAVVSADVNDRECAAALLAAEASARELKEASGLIPLS